MQKIRKVLFVNFSWTWKTSFWAYWPGILINTLEIDIFPHKCIWFNFKDLCCRNLMQKRSSLHWFSIALKKLDFGPILGPSWPKNFKKLFHRVHTSQTCYCNSIQKNPEKYHAFVFDKTWNTFFWTHFRPLLGY